MNLDNLNWDQHRLTEKSCHGLPIPKQHREILMRAVQGGHPIIAEMSRSGHAKLHIKNDGTVVTAGTGGRGRGDKNFEAQLRRNLRSVGADMLRKGESLKQFTKRTQASQGQPDQPEVNSPADNE